MGSVEELRACFEKRLAQGIPNPPGELHPKDLERVQDDEYLYRVLQHAKNDMTNASKILWAIMKWRKINGASDITQEHIRMDYVNLGLFFPHGRDMEGCRMLVVKCKHYSRSQTDFDEVKKILIYWLDRVEREENGRRVTLFLDLAGAGLGNFDIDLIKYMINLFFYYPKFLNQIVIYQLPWLLTATFKVVKRLLPPEAVEIMKFASKETVLKEIVRPDEALTCWGGKNNYQFKFVPEKKTNKKVSFSTTIDNQESSASTISNMTIEDSTIPTNSTNTSDEILSIEPSDKIAFKNESEEIIGRIKIMNLEEKPLAFKIRTTGPEKFWVRPCSGIIQAKKTEAILITILPGYEKTAIRERFSVMATPTNNTDQKDLSVVWRNALNCEIEEHRLKCHIIEDITKNHVNNNNNVTNSVEVKTDLNKEALDGLRKDVKVLKNQLVQLQFYQYLSIVLGLMSLFLGYLIYKDVNRVSMRDEL